MLGTGRPAVKPSPARKPLSALGFAAPGGSGQTGPPSPRAVRVTWIPALLLAAAVLLAVSRLATARSRRRRQAVAQLLDAADALEDRLRTARTEIEAVAGAERNPVRDAMQEMLRHRLWLQQHGAAASLSDLDTVREAIDAARHSIDHQLLRIERARAPLP